MADISLKDIDVAELYDAFNILILEQLGMYGFCEPGEEGPFVLEGNTKIDGRIPINTSGTEQSWTYLQGFTHITEAALQLRGEAGGTQVEDPETVLVGAYAITGFGTATATTIWRK
jgi:acetyl-CoA acetyltransferase